MLPLGASVPCSFFQTLRSWKKKIPTFTVYIFLHTLSFWSIILGTLILRWWWNCLIRDHLKCHFNKSGKISSSFLLCIYSVIVLCFCPLSCVFISMLLHLPILACLLSHPIALSMTVILLLWTMCFIWVFIALVTLLFLIVFSS